MKIWLIIHDRWLQSGGYYKELDTKLFALKVAHSLVYRKHNPYRKLNEALAADVVFLHNTDDEDTNFFNHSKGESKYWIIFSGSPGFKGMQKISSNQVRIAGDLLVKNIEDFISDFVENKRPNFELLGAPCLVIPLSNLKHSIAHCFLSIDMDLQAISTTCENNEEAKKYLAGVLWGDEGKSPKPSGYYVGQLEKARGLAGLEENESDESDTIRKIVQDQNLQNNEWWICVKELLGDCSANDKINSPIYPLLKSLDDLLDEGRNKYQNEQLALLGDSKIQLFIEYFGNLQKCWDEQEEKNIEWRFDDHFEKLISKKDKYSFHDWLTALDEALDKLRGDLPT